MTRRIAATLVAVLALGLAGTAGGAAAATERIKLPTRADAIAAAALVEQLLNGKNSPLLSRSGLGGLETRLPGPVTDEEHVVVGVGPDGTPVAVQVVQRLHLSGLGDFSFKIPGPATDVQGLAGSEEQPGLRKGAVLWQGFSPGERDLGAVLDLHPDLEVQRLPLRFTIHATVGGKAVSAEQPRSGPFEMTIRIENTSSVPVTISDAPTHPEDVAAALDAVRASLLHRRRPVPGQGGIPAALDATGPARSRSERIEAPFSVSGSVVSLAGSLAGLHVEGAPVALSGSLGGFEGQLGGGGPLAMTVRITGTAHHLRLPPLTITAHPAPPLSSAVAPPGGGSWAAFAASHPGASTRMAGLLLATMWRTARLAQYDAYLGNPDPTGPASSTYTFHLVPKPVAAAEQAPEAAGNLEPFGVAVVSVVGLLLLFGLAVAWSRA